MKKSLLILSILGAAVCGSFHADAQQVYKNRFVTAVQSGVFYTTSLDTLTNTVAAKADTFTQKIPGTYKTATIWIDATKISGNMGGNISWQSSCDTAASWIVDSVTNLANSTKSYREIITNNPNTNYRAIINDTSNSGVGQQSSYRGYLLLRQ
jgi:hypothetical protein